MKYEYSDPRKRLSVKVLNENNEELFSVDNRTWMDVGELFTTKYLTDMIQTTVPKSRQPEAVRVLVYSDYYKVE